MRAKLLFAMPCDPCRDFPQGVKPAGTLIDHPQAFRLVQQGCAEPVDPQCRARAGVSGAKLEDLKRKYQRADRGIWPIDWDAYDAGLMVGYNEDSSWKPGPNWTDGCEEEYYAVRAPEDEVED